MVQHADPVIGLAGRARQRLPLRRADERHRLVYPASLEDIDFLYGVFDGDLVDKRDGDFVFTILSDPVRHIFDLFDYLRSSTASRRQRTASPRGFPCSTTSSVREVDRFLDGDR